ncbi:DoxX family membrane protein [Frankia sp. CNm7]|uniref:DoxX family membrane protein n=1 Tax=Frankia nepalensis TaxID=1836974 RepID=A0A937R8D8_9ACTN|nr:DoxX family membrane protein [Frankia nepalensis]MBL7499460.1 DoxX family membrane protein [Frankia nepalensis]MBL7516092.1 DoxX family membrane protein [Frankia nepalensis]MBL7522889.1 DoxX family membrane protein [Frankia nepalensis]MBL7625642.1 DoxX family membrane protein [Frankia nepalensis]
MTTTKATTAKAGTRPGVVVQSPFSTLFRQREGARGLALDIVLALTRISLGWVFLWAFLDKLFGLGHGTASKAAWINGGSPTEGFLSHGAVGPFTSFYHDIAGAVWADYLFMIGLAAIGTALLLGVGVRVAAGAGAILLVMMWTVVLPPENNPFMDDHLVYALTLILLAALNAGRSFGLGGVWARTALVRGRPYLV